jgi:hypothetical protein
MKRVREPRRKRRGHIFSASMTAIFDCADYDSEEDEEANATQPPRSTISCNEAIKAQL